MPSHTRIHERLSVSITCIHLPIALYSSHECRNSVLWLPLSGAIHNTFEELLVKPQSKGFVVQNSVVDTFPYLSCVARSHRYGFSACGLIGNSRPPLTSPRQNPSCHALAGLTAASRASASCRVRHGHSFSHHSQNVWPSHPERPQSQC